VCSVLKNPSTLAANVKKFSIPGDVRPGNYAPPDVHDVEQFGTDLSECRRTTGFTYV